MAEADQPHLLISRLCVGHTKMVMFVTFLLSLVMGFVGMAVGAPELAASFSARSDPVVEQMDAFLESRTSSFSDDSVSATRSESLIDLNVYFKSKSGDVFSQANLASIADTQAKFLAIAGLSDWCQLAYDDSGTALGCTNPDSPLDIVTTDAALDDDCSASCGYTAVPECQLLDPLYAAEVEPLTDDADVRARMYEVCSAPAAAVEDACAYLLYAYDLGVLPKAEFQTCDSATDVRSVYTRFSHSFGAPLEGYTSLSDSIESQWEELGEAMDEDVGLVAELFDLFDEIEGDNSDLELYFFSLVVDSTSYYLARDMMFVSLSVVLVGSIIWFQTQSAFVAIVGLYEILISFPVTFFFYAVVGNQEYITVLSYLSIFIVLGVGADDIFVFVDCWKQSAQQHPEIADDLMTRFDWAYRRAAHAMLITSLTTFVAFMSLAASPIWDVACFGIFTGSLILVDYIMAITWLPSCIVFYERNLRARCGHKCCGCCAAPRICPPQEGTEAAKEAATKHRPIEIFFRDTYTDGILRHRVPLLVAFVVVVVGTTVAWSLGLQPATSEPTFFADDHPYSVAKAIHDDSFGASTDELKVQLWSVYGIDLDEAIDRDGSHPADRDFLGTPQYDGVDLSSAAAQEDLIAVCDALLTEGQAAGRVDATGGSYCFMEDFKLWREFRGDAFPFDGSEADMVAELLVWRDSEEMHGGVNRTNFMPDYFDGTGFLANGAETGLSMAFVGVNTTMPLSNIVFTELESSYLFWKGVQDEQNSLRTALPNGFQGTFFWNWYITSMELTDSAFRNVILSLSLAVVVLLSATRNWRLVGLAFLSMYGILSMCFSLLAAAGWEINVLESIAISVATGLAVDYTVHLSLAYHESAEQTREARLRESLATMGVSVLSGALTTVAACSALFGCDLLWFSTFGAFVVALCSSAIFITLLFMTALLGRLGPHTREDGDLNKYLPESLRTAVVTDLAAPQRPREEPEPAAVELSPMAAS